MKYFLLILFIGCSSLKAQPKADTLRNLEYVTVNYFFNQKKLYHVRYMVYDYKKKWYYYPNHSPVHLINYKQKDSAEVTVKQD